MNRMLLVWLSDEFSEADVVALRQMVEAIAGSRRWTVGAPEFVNETDSSSCTVPEDEPIRTVGAILEVTDRATIPATPREEVAEFIDAMATFSRERDLEMEVELGDTYAGEIRAGVTDRLIREGLLATW